MWTTVSTGKAPRFVLDFLIQGITLKSHKWEISVWFGFKHIQAEPSGTIPVSNLKLRNSQEHKLFWGTTDICKKLHKHTSIPHYARAGTCLSASCWTATRLSFWTASGKPHEADFYYFAYRHAMHTSHPENNSEKQNQTE